MLLLALVGSSPALGPFLSFHLHGYRQGCYNRVTFKVVTATIPRQCVILAVGKSPGNNDSERLNSNIEHAGMLSPTLVH